MIYTVNSAFEYFNANYVNLDPKRVEIARGSRDWLFGQLNALPGKESTFPISYQDKHNKYGSFARKTKIRELNDVDIIYCMSATGATYLKSNAHQNKYFLYTTDAGSRLKDLSVNDILDSNKVINEVKSCLKDIPYYSKAEIHKKGEAVTLALSSYEWNFDILPAFYTDTEHYLIPDSQGNWMATNPDVDQERVTAVNQFHSGKVLQIIRTLKYWNRETYMPIINSYLFETIIINYFNSRPSINQYIKYNLKDFWSHLRTSIYNSVHDPKGFDGDINDISFGDKIKIADAAATAYNRSYDAIYAEISESDQIKSIKKWREIFGASFPAYGSNS